MARPARMSDVAKAAGVSIMTVSRALNGNPNVTDETRQRVFAAIKQLHYHRNELARSLREKRTRQIGILVPNLFDPFFANCVHVMGVVARQHNYSVIIATSNEDPDCEFDEANRMLYRNVEGVLVIPAAPAAPTSCRSSTSSRPRVKPRVIACSIWPHRPARFSRSARSSAGPGC